MSTQIWLKVNLTAAALSALYMAAGSTWPQAVLSESDFPGVPRDIVVAVYGDSSADCTAVVEHLRRIGFSRAAQLKGDFECWPDSGMPLEDRRYR
jgi:rhodanese-related sulfurtransferase